MVGVMMMTFILLFAFVINTGMLVNAKINLQNAADLAAYAGASAQGRQLTHISYLNYEMRRQWKKFLFRLFVVGNMAQDGFQNLSSGPMHYIPDNSTGEDLQIPTTCIVFNAKDNFCHLQKLPAISIPAETFLDSITDTLRGQLQAIEKIRQLNCQAIGQTNKMVNFYWLYNPDPTASNFLDNDVSSLTGDQRNAMKIIRTLVFGLGIVPREMILKFRIDTLNGYVNTPPQQGVTLSKINTLKNGPDPSAYERTIQAFYSAYYTLGNHTYAGSTIALDELLPKSLLKLNPIEKKFETYTIDLSTGTNQYGAASENPSDCIAKTLPVPINAPLPLGVYKDPSVLTYYAVRLRATARILFSPFGDLEMKAYSAAQPFGSRIGPAPTEVGFTYTTDFRGGTATIPNLAISNSESLPTKGTGWDRQEVLSLMFRKLYGGAGTGTAAIGADALETAYQNAMAPNPWEKEKYNIINDEGTDSFIRNFDPSGIASIWAPIFPPDKISQSSAAIKQAVNDLFASNIQGNLGAEGPAALQKLQDTISKGLEKYIDVTLVSNGGENGESINIAKITNPFKVQGQPITGDPNLILTDPKQFKSSWNTVNDGAIRTEGRVGYSVKFIAFENLTSKKLPTNGSTTWSNDFPLDGETVFDVPALRH